MNIKDLFCLIKNNEWIRKENKEEDKLGEKLDDLLKKDLSDEIFHEVDSLNAELAFIHEEMGFVEGFKTAASLLTNDPVGLLDVESNSKYITCANGYRLKLKDLPDNMRTIQLTLNELCCVSAALNYYKEIFGDKKVKTGGTETARQILKKIQEVVK